MIKCSPRGGSRWRLQNIIAQQIDGWVLWNGPRGPGPEGVRSTSIFVFVTCPLQSIRSHALRTPSALRSLATQHSHRTCSPRSLHGGSRRSPPWCWCEKGHHPRLVQEEHCHEEEVAAIFCRGSRLRCFELTMKQLLALNKKRTASYVVSS